MRGLVVLKSGGAAASATAHSNPAQGLEIGRVDSVNRRILNPAQGLESGRDAGEVRVMTCIRV